MWLDKSRFVLDILGMRYLRTILRRQCSSEGAFVLERENAAAVITLYTLKQSYLHILDDVTLLVVDNAF